MSFGLYETQLKRRRQRRRVFIRNFMMIAALVGTGWASYESGHLLNLTEIDALNTQIEEYETRVSDLQIEQARTQGELKVARQEIAAWKARYEDEVPSGQRAELLNLMEQRLADGIPLKRLQFVVSTVKVNRSCSNDPHTKRFVVRTPLTKGANDTVTYAQGGITISARGLSKRTESGAPQAWFDPAEPLVITITQIGGEGSEIEGKLPLHFSLVRGDLEHRFSAREGEQRGFISITEDTCNYP